MPEELTTEQLAKIIVYTLENYSTKRTSDASGVGMYSVWKYRKLYITN